MEEVTFKPRLRVSLLEPSGAIISDRLVDAQSEYYAGPKQKHTGPVRIEVTLTNNEDIDNFKKYLDQLKGNLPIKAPSVGRGRPSSANTAATESPREDIYMAVQNMANEGKSQTQVIKYLRDLGFVFLLTEDFLEYFPDFNFNAKDIGKPTENKQYLDSMSWMVRCVKRAKDPRTDKFDPMIIFGFNIMDLRKPSKKVVVYLYKERKDPLRIITGKKLLSFSQVEFTKFPKYMLEDERMRFSVEQRQLLLNDSKKPSKFFIRWYKDVVFPDSLKEKLESIIKRGEQATTE